MKEVLNAQEAARVLGVNGALVRHNLKSGIWGFGRVIKKEKLNGKQDKYIICTRDMCKYFGIPTEKVEDALNGIS